MIDNVMHLMKTDPMFPNKVELLGILKEKEANGEIKELPEDLANYLEDDSNHPTETFNPTNFGYNRIYSLQIPPTPEKIEYNEDTLTHCYQHFKHFSDNIKENLSFYEGKYESFIDHGPDLLQLLTTLLINSALSVDMKLKLSTALAYFVAPNDIIPEDKYGPYGYIDDIFLCSHVLKDISTQIDHGILEECWCGQENLEKVINTCYAESMFILGKKCNTVLEFVSFAEKFNFKDLNLDDCLIKGENEEIEFKSTLLWDVNQKNVNKKLQNVIVKTIAGFLNFNGGILLIGVEDDGTIYGIEHDIPYLKKKDKDGFEQRLIQVIENNLGLNVMEHIKITFEEKYDKNVCLVKIKSSPEPIFVETNEGPLFYLRAGCTTKPLNNKQQYKYINLHWNRMANTVK
ncbi:RNA-binding domain-containing protein [Methanobacterium ferruginis]|uniref:RNA-binding domain-containing protein n=1 Tax=Methanobacterium ferruginis TaxID=710191 RepID=UPI00257476EA|nr:RNA-binding domain-containing protein [Methanobacterium ferruginis]BDZ68743.1 hypothetical protein GCM10025860_21910 [Methanobacterium ferruginis]